MTILTALLLAAASGVGEAPRSKADGKSSHIEVRRIEGASPATGPMIAYEVEYVRTNQLGWRGQFDPWLKPIARQGGAMIWSASASTLDELTQYLQSDSSSHILKLPKVTTPAGGEVQMTQGNLISYVAHLERIANGPLDRATRLEIKPQIEQILDGVMTRISSGTKDSHGLRAHVMIDRDHIRSFQTSAYSEMVVPDVVEEGDRRDRTLARPAKLSGTIQVPVLDSTRVDGEWVIPLNGALIVSIGTGQKKGGVLGFSEVRPEELVIIRYQHEPGKEPTPILPAGATQTSAASRPARRKSAAAN